MLHVDFILSVYLVFSFQDNEVESYRGSFIKTRHTRAQWSHLIIKRSPMFLIFHVNTLRTIHILSLGVLREFPFVFKIF